MSLVIKSDVIKTYLANLSLGEWEHKIVSSIKAIIPNSVKQTWRDWRSSMKQAERDMTGSDDISEHVEMAGWGVEEAEEANKKDASMLSHTNLALRPLT